MEERDPSAHLPCPSQDTSFVAEEEMALGGLSAEWGMVSGLERDPRVLPGCGCPVVLPVTPVTVVAGSGGSAQP